LTANSLILRNSTNFFPAAFSRQRLFDAFLFAWFQVEGVFLDFLNNIFLLHFAFESPQCILNGFAILNPNFRHSIHPLSASNRPTIIPCPRIKVKLLYFASTDLWLSVLYVPAGRPNDFVPQKTGKSARSVVGQNVKLKSIVPAAAL